MERNNRLIHLRKIGRRFRIAPEYNQEIADLCGDGRRVFAICGVNKLIEGETLRSRKMFPRLDYCMLFWIESSHPIKKVHTIPDAS
jgi:hypothetical protein